MNFFQRQTETRRLSRRLVLLFVLAVIAVILAVDLVIMVLLASAEGDSAVGAGAWVAQHPRVLVMTSVCVFAVIALSSLYKTATLSAGGGVVARSLGGVRVSPDTKDAAQRRLLNVVEEMSIASGVPMPEVYLLEQELGINAFAAGHTPANAAVAVTRGALDNLQRDELQGVIAHEFSHILNGDMRLNIRLLGLLFGLLVIALIARTVLRYAPRGRSNKKGGAGAIMLAALAVLIIGYVGLFFGRLIQAAVSRSRESLADASAVQFTRDPTGLRDALVKIGAATAGSHLAHPEAEEVAHMLFAPGMARLFATHPPLLERLRAIDPRFQPSEFDAARTALAQRHAAATAQPEEKSGIERLQDVLNVPRSVTPGRVVQLMGNPGTAQVQLAQAIRRSLPAELVAASQLPTRARALLFGLGLASDAGARQLQLRFIEQQAGAEVRQAVDHLIEALDALDPLQRLPLLTRAFPALRQLARTERQQLIATLNGMLVRDGRLRLSTYALRKLAQVQLHDEMSPGGRIGKLPLSAVRSELRTLFAVLAREGHSDERAAGAAFEAGMRALGTPTNATFELDANWPARLDAALNRLDLLQPAAKQLLIEALVKTITHDQQLAVTEAELLRAVCASLHCPLPLLVEG